MAHITAPKAGWYEPELLISAVLDWLKTRIPVGPTCSRLSLLYEFCNHALCAGSNAPLLLFADDHRLMLISRWTRIEIAALWFALPATVRRDVMLGPNSPNGVVSPDLFRISWNLAWQELQVQGLQDARASIVAQDHVSLVLDVAAVMSIEQYVGSLAASNTNLYLDRLPRLTFLWCVFHVAGSALQRDVQHHPSPS